MAFRQVREVRHRKHYGGKIFTALLLVGALVAGAWYVFGRTPDTKTVHADFAFVNGLYTGSKVTVLGVPVGKIDDVEPRGDHVRVTMTIPGDVRLPAAVQAYVLNPSVISDRHLELGPAYTTGPELGDGATIPQDRTHSPISFDQLMESLGVLTKIMGPSDGPQKDDLGSLLSRTARSWDGGGTEFNTAVGQLASASGIIGARGEDIQDLIDSLNQLMQTFHAKQVSLDG